MLIHTAAKRGLLHLVEKKIALNEGLENLVHRTNRKQLEYPLHAAAMGGHIACVSALIEAKAMIDSLDRRNETPLIWAVRAGHAPVIQMLVDAGASIHRPTFGGPIPIHVAASSGHVASIKALLDVGACLTDADSDGWTPIMTAVRYGNAAAVRFLHEAGAPIDVLPPLKRNWTQSRNLLQFAVKCEQPECTALLMKLGADYLLPDSDGQTVEEFMNMQYESDIEKQRSNFFTQLNELPVSIRIDHRMLLQRYICNMNNIHSGEPVDLQWTDYSKFKAQHQVEGMMLEEIIDLSPELTEALVIERMTEDGLFWQYHADLEGDGNV